MLVRRHFWIQCVHWLITWKIIVVVYGQNVVYDLANELYKNCPCDSAGSLDPCEQPCRCKANVVGTYCDQCRPSYFNLDARNPAGCSACFCFAGAADPQPPSCQSSNWSISFITSDFQHTSNELQAEDSDSKMWMVCDLDTIHLWNLTSIQPARLDEYISMGSDELAANVIFYWQAPKDFLGNQLYSYGNELHVKLSYSVLRGDVSGGRISNFWQPDVVLTGLIPSRVAPKSCVRLDPQVDTWLHMHMDLNDRNLISFLSLCTIGFQWSRYARKLEPEVKVNIRIPLRESEWNFVDNRLHLTSDTVDRAQFAYILNRLQGIWIRGKFHTDQIEGRLWFVNMGIASGRNTSSASSNTGGDLSVARATEQCQCVYPRVGLSCEQCAFGHRLVWNDAQHSFLCERCHCDVEHIEPGCEHSCSCDALSSDGKCNRCSDGFFGNPSHGQPCRRCACPPQSKCITSTSGLDYECVPCPPGMTGSKCDRCERGYFGDPTTGRPCRPCDCAPTMSSNGSRAVVQCDPWTGSCVCSAHVQGDHCDRCEAGFFSADVTRHPCLPCDCNAFGSQTDMFGLQLGCDHRTGQCVCRPRFAGRQCDLCAAGYERFDLNCIACDCRSRPPMSACINLLLQDAHSIHAALNTIDVQRMRSIPWLQLSDLNTRVRQANRTLYIFRIPQIVNVLADQKLTNWLRSDWLSINQFDFNESINTSKSGHNLNRLAEFNENSSRAIMFELELLSLQFPTGPWTDNQSVWPVAPLLGSKYMDEHSNGWLERALLRLHRQAAGVAADVRLIGHDCQVIHIKADEMWNQVQSVHEELQSWLRALTRLQQLRSVQHSQCVADSVVREYEQQAQRWVRALNQPSIDRQHLRVHEAMDEAHELSVKVKQRALIAQQSAAAAPLFDRLLRLNTVCLDALDTLERRVSQPVLDTREIIRRSEATYGQIERFVNARQQHDSTCSKMAEQADVVLKQIALDLGQIRLLYEAFPLRFRQLNQLTIEKLQHTLIRLSPENEEKYVHMCESHAGDLVHRLNALKIQLQPFVDDDWIESISDASNVSIIDHLNQTDLIHSKVLSGSIGPMDEENNAIGRLDTSLYKRDDLFEEDNESIDHVKQVLNNGSLTSHHVSVSHSIVSMTSSNQSVSMSNESSGDGNATQVITSHDDQSILIQTKASTDQQYESSMTAVAYGENGVHANKIKRDAPVQVNVTQHTQTIKKKVSIELTGSGLKRPVQGIAAYKQVINAVQQAATAGMEAEEKLEELIGFYQERQGDDMNVDIKVKKSNELHQTVNDLAMNRLPAIGQQLDAKSNQIETLRRNMFIMDEINGNLKVRNEILLSIEQELNDLANRSKAFRDIQLRLPDTLRRLAEHEQLIRKVNQTALNWQNRLASQLRHRPPVIADTEVTKIHTSLEHKSKYVKSFESRSRKMEQLRRIMQKQLSEIADLVNQAKQRAASIRVPLTNQPEVQSVHSSANANANANANATQNKCKRIFDVDMQTSAANQIDFVFGTCGSIDASSKYLILYLGGGSRSWKAYMQPLLDSSEKKRRQQPLSVTNVNNSYVDISTMVVDNVTTITPMLTSVNDIWNDSNANLSWTTPSSRDVWLETNEEWSDMADKAWPSGKSVDFFAFQLVNRQIQLVWNIGEGVRRLIHPLQLHTPPVGTSRTKDHWYRIQMTRVAGETQLSVRPLISNYDEDDEIESLGSELSSHHLQSNSSSVVDLNKGSIRFDWQADGQLIVGGVPRYLMQNVSKTPEFLESTSLFAGCLHDVRLDGRRISLWNFRSSRSCTGCKEPQIDLPEPSHVFSFSGRKSMAVVPQIVRYESHRYLLQLQFRSIESNCVLFACVNLVTGDAVVLGLEDGHVRFQFAHGRSQIGLVLITQRRYNNGQWISVNADREHFDALLRVQDEQIEGTATYRKSMVSSGNSVAAFNSNTNTSVTIANEPTHLHSRQLRLDLRDSYVFFGSLPVNLSSSWWPASSNSFVGCLRDVQLDNTPLDLAGSGSYGIEKGCSSAGRQHSMIFLGDGYVRSDSFALNDHCEISFVFSSQNPNAFLLSSSFSSKDIQKTPYLENHFYSIALVNGLIVGQFKATGRVDPKVISHVKIMGKQPLNDSQLHTVLLQKRQRKIFLYVDDQEVGVIRLARGVYNIQAPNSGGMYIGGTPEQVSKSDIAPTYQPLVGMIKDLAFNHTLIVLDQKHFFDSNLT